MHFWSLLNVLGHYLRKYGTSFSQKLVWSQLDYFTNRLLQWALAYGLASKTISCFQFPTPLFFQGGNYTIFWAKSWQFCGTPQIKPSLSTFLKKRTNRAKRTVSHLQKMQFRVEESPSQKFHLIFIDHVKNDKKSTKLDAISND